MTSRLQIINPELTEYIRRYVSFSDNENEVFQSFLRVKKLNKKDFLLREGQLCKSRYFVVKGCVRLYYIDSKGNEQIIHFGIDKWWITDYESLINDIPSKLYIQATEDAELLELSRERFDELCRRIPKLERFFRKIMEKTYISSQKRIEYMFSMSGEELFKHFIANNPEFARRVPQYMIASYLGLSPEFVSKVKRKNPVLNLD
ncbi:hypothetical protein FUAX_36560 [Fulvitalea axinellae]|uniref:Cyclic nucleotide-binding domain-containing protein n=1 Tax=Fulvitalea axinellae TaxID=1182444 RepID=A0AAU9D9H8_9BACT|nr:hypothetical protein FUAX_36560 [Fulvitalea axinellae]